MVLVLRSGPGFQIPFIKERFELGVLIIWQENVEVLPQTHKLIITLSLEHPIGQGVESVNPALMGSEIILNYRVT